jgi:hypothetical protein
MYVLGGLCFTLQVCKPRSGSDCAPPALGRCFRSVYRVTDSSLYSFRACPVDVIAPYTPVFNGALVHMKSSGFLSLFFPLNNFYVLSDPLQSQPHTARLRRSLRPWESPYRPQVLLASLHRLGSQLGISVDCIETVALAICLSTDGYLYFYSCGPVS